MHSQKWSKADGSSSPGGQPQCEILHTSAVIPSQNKHKSTANHQITHTQLTIIKTYTHATHRQDTHTNNHCPSSGHTHNLLTINKHKQTLPTSITHKQTLPTIQTHTQTLSTIKPCTHKYQHTNTHTQVNTYTHKYAAYHHAEYKICPNFWYSDSPYSSSHCMFTAILVFVHRLERYCQAYSSLPHSAQQR